MKKFSHDSHLSIAEFYTLPPRMAPLSFPTDKLIHKVIIIGSGPAAHTAAIYAGRAQLNPILFEGFMAGGIAAGGQLTTTTDVENFPGFPEGVGGIELMERMRNQSIHCGTTIHTRTVESVDLSKRPFSLQDSEGEHHYAQCLIVCTGASAKRLDVPGSQDPSEGGYWQRGVSACAVCDGAAPIFRQKSLVVVGGGDTAMEEATFLTKYASTVHLIHRRDELRASSVMQKRALSHPKIKFWPSTRVVEVRGDDNLMSSVVIEHLKNSGKQTILDAAGLFFAIGHQPNTGFLAGQLELDATGYIVTKPGTTQTSVYGVFAAGDVQDKRYRQAVTAAGTGCMAALEAEHYLQEIADQL